MIEPITGTLLAVILGLQIVVLIVIVLKWYLSIGDEAETTLAWQLRTERDELARLCEVYLDRIDQRLMDDNGQLALVEALRGYKWSLRYEQDTGDIVLGNMRANLEYHLTADGGLLLLEETGEYSHSYCALCGDYSNLHVEGRAERKGWLCTNCRAEVAKDGLRQLGIKFPGEDGDGEVSEETR